MMAALTAALAPRSAHADCTPTTESCNGVDDDCDGVIDNGATRANVCGLGVCAHTGTATCGGQPIACEPLAGTVAETCNGLDDDCDGLTDEASGLSPCGTGICARWLPACGMTCNPLHGAAAEVCNGQDDDCDGETDDGLTGCTPQGSGCSGGDLDCSGSVDPAGETNVCGGCAAIACTALGSACGGGYLDGSSAPRQTRQPACKHPALTWRG